MTTITHDFDMDKTNKKGFDVPAGFPIPVNKSVIIEKVGEENKTKSGLILTENAGENNVGVIMAAADDCHPLFKAGTRVMYNMYEDRTIRFEENHYLIMHETSIFCILPEKATLLPMPKNKKAEKTNEYIKNEQARLIKQHKREQNKLDEIMETKKKIFNKKK